VAVLTNVELDHVRAFRSRLEVEDVFRSFLSRSAHAVIWDRPELLALREGPAVAFDARAPDLSPQGSRFRWRGLDVTLNVPGEHNARNAAAALEASVLAGADPATAVKALASFQGTRRRLEFVGETAAGATIYDDYGHHPTAVRATVAAARTLEPDRLVAVLQPYSFARVRMMRVEFGEALALADSIVSRPSRRWPWPGKPPLPRAGERWPGCRISYLPSGTYVASFGAETSASRWGPETSGGSPDA